MEFGNEIEEAAGGLTDWTGLTRFTRLTEGERV
jgi:hypothetical protein